MSIDKVSEDGFLCCLDGVDIGDNSVDFVMVLMIFGSGN